MLKILVCMIFSIPLFCSWNFWIMVQNLLFIFSFLFLLNFFIMMDWGFLSYILGADVLSSSLIFLSIWICSLMILASYGVLKSKFNFLLFLVLVFSLLFFLCLTFMVTDMLFFYISFEVSLIPTLLLITGWGYQPERLQAGIYLLFYTLFGSLPLLMGILKIYGENGGLSFLCLMLNFNWSLLSMVWYVVMIGAFLIKMPMYMLHLWLPKAHVEAPVAGSMILAGVLLKLGGYGLFRVMTFMSMVGKSLNLIWVIISLLGCISVSLMCLRQSDLKALIAYSSVAHMGIVIAGLMSMTYWGLESCLLLMIGHGLCSSGLFALVNICYERLGSRSLSINKGLMSLMPSLAMWWFLLSSSNMAAPPSLNLGGEIGLINSIMFWNFNSIYSLAFVSFFSAAYMLYLFSISQHGQNFSGLFSFCSGSCREFLLLFLHWFPLNYLILGVDFCIYWL
uniref:NADH-ubiquinone oxidoreductase chain 4 n=1 Tax=Songmachilis xinxiangensis TaxID=1224734 RepID=R4IJR7_9INSE|nr:NADH dehydrogenase subunit 4 [Songmachilis xinxiangensis]AFQ07909.1 NADH dehydrogenase subunit 4 [Songmachilis xinxiangensis]